MVRASRPGVTENLDARDLTPSFTAGALRGGSHVHVFSPDGAAVSFTYEEAWIGTNGYVRADGSRQRRAIAFQGDVVTAKGATISEVFILDLPGDLAALSVAGDQPIVPDGRRIAYVRHIAGSDDRAWNQIFTVETR